MTTFTDEELKQMCIVAIKNYLNNPRFSNEYILNNFELAVNLMMENYKSVESSRGKGVTKITQGQRSVWFDENTSAFQIGKDVAALLPPPYVRLY